MERSEISSVSSSRLLGSQKLRPSFVSTFLTIVTFVFPSSKEDSSHLQGDTLSGVSTFCTKCNRRSRGSQAGDVISFTLPFLLSLSPQPFDHGSWIMNWPSKVQK